MIRRHLLFLPSSLCTVLLLVSLALAQSDKAKKQEKPAPKKNPYGQTQGFGEANLKFDILESQIQTLRKKMQLRTKSNAEQSKEWNEHYEKVKQQIEAWDKFVDSYNAK